jgi:RNA polymerase-binding transcription factor DksA
MSSTSTLQPAARRSLARWQRGSAPPVPAAGRAVHLGPGGLAQRRALLEACWRDRLERVTALSLAYHDAAQSSPPAGPGNGGVSNGRRSDGRSGDGSVSNSRAGNGGTANGQALSRRARQLARQAVAERQALAEIEAALDRMTAGHYGWCEQCGRPIAAALLAAQPQARYCTACERQPSHSMAQA